MDLTTASLLKFLHVLVAFWFIAGLLARNLTMGQASRVSSVHSVEAFTQLAGRLDNLMVIPGSLVVFLLGLVTAWEQGWPLLGSLAGGDSDWLFVSILIYLSIMPLVPAVFLPRGRKFDQSLQEALKQGEVTADLKLALTDKVVRAAHAYELGAIATVIFLMVTKPF